LIKQIINLKILNGAQDCKIIKRNKDNTRYYNNCRQIVINYLYIIIILLKMFILIKISIYLMETHIFNVDWMKKDNVIMRMMKMGSKRQYVKNNYCKVILTNEMIHYIFFK
jgi:hypothetical protein